METGSVPPVAISVLAGWGAWTLTEYVAHRWILHPHLRGPLAAALSAEHRMHHRDPMLTRPALRAAGHLTIWLLALGGTYAGARLTTGDPPAAPVVGLAAGWALGYSVYELGHWRTHHRRSRPGPRRAIRRHHLIHHRDRTGVNYGVTVDWWDRVFGTRRTSTGRQEQG